MVHYVYTSNRRVNNCDQRKAKVNPAMRFYQNYIYMPFTPFNVNTCKLQLYFIEILEISPLLFEKLKNFNEPQSLAMINTLHLLW